MSFWYKQLRSSWRGKIFFLLSFLFLSCTNSRPIYFYSPKNLLVRPIPSNFNRRDYLEVLRAWSRESKIYHDLEDKIFVHATLHSSEFKQAFSWAFPDIYGHGGDITRQELGGINSEVENHHNFFLSVYTPDVRWNDLAKKNSIWHVILINAEGQIFDPKIIIPIKTDENIRTVYPYVNDFHKCYIVRFPKIDAYGAPLINHKTNKVTLQIASAIAKADLTWEFNIPKDL